MQVTNAATATEFCTSWAATSPSRQVLQLTFAIEVQEFCADMAHSYRRTQQELNHREAIGVLRLRRLRVRQAAGLHA